MGVAVKPQGRKLSKIEGQGNSQAENLDELMTLSGGDVNAIIVWRKDGEVDFYISEGKRAKPGDGSTTLRSPKKSMRDFELPAADIVLINGTPKIASINGIRYELEDVSQMP